jgi:hypothetical protein
MDAHASPGSLALLVLPSQSSCVPKTSPRTWLHDSRGAGTLHLTWVHTLGAALTTTCTDFTDLPLL